MGAEVTVVAPGTLLPPRPDVLGADHVAYCLDDVLPELDVDVVHDLRIQRERLEGAPFPSLREYHQLFGLTKKRERLMKPDAIVCHPGPINRGVEFVSYMPDHPERSVHPLPGSTPVSACAWLPCICCLEVPTMALLLKNAHVVDPSVELDDIVDVLIEQPTAS